MKKYLAMLAVVLMGWSCDKYDDTALKGRIDGLEDRVTKLEQQLKTLNDGYEAIQKLVGDGFVTGFVENGDSYTITVKNADGSSKNYTLKKAEKGDKGDKGDTGAAGKDGSTPVFTLGGPDSEGRYWWLIDGVEAKDANGNRVYASGTNGTNGSDGQPGTPGDKGDKGDQGDKGDKGDQGDKGEDGVTPHLAVAPEKDGQPDFSNDDATAVLHWWVSYDWDGDDATATWEDLGVAKGQADDVVITASFENGHLKIFVNGVEQVDVVISADAAAPIKISLSIDGEPVEEYSTVSFAKDETVIIAVAAEGTGENAIVKAELLNPGYGYSLYVNGADLKLKATGAEDCKTNKLLIEVVDGGVSRYTWLGLETLYSASISIAEVDGYDYMPVAFGSGYTSSINRYAVKPTVTLTLDSPAEEDMTINVSYADVDDEYTVPGLAAIVSIPGTVTVKKGEQSVQIPCTIPSREKLECDMGILISAESENVMLSEAYFYIANNFSIKLPLTATNFECPFDAVSDGEGNGLDALCDDDPNTFLGTYYWTVDAFKEHANSIASYGVFVDVNLPSAVSEIQFKYQNRNGLNGQPRGLKFGYYMYGMWMTLGSEKTSGFNEGNSEWNESAAIPVNGGACDKFRFGVTKSITQQENNLCFNPEGSMTLAELQVWAKY